MSAPGPPGTDARRPGTSSGSGARATPHPRKLEDMLTGFPKAIPEIPVADVEKAAAYYVNVLGFNLDWGDDQGGIGGISQGSAESS